MSAFPTSTYRPCPDCGASVHMRARSKHTCDPERRLDYLMFQCREEIASFERLLREYLTSPAGRFAQWLAERQRPPLAGM